MKKSHIKLKIFALLALVLITSICMTSCAQFIASIGIIDEIFYGEEDSANSNETPDSSISTNTPDNDTAIKNEITINGDSTSDVVYAAAVGLLSSVSIYCAPNNSASYIDYSSAGSGVIYQIDENSGSAFIITNYHVVYNSSTYKINNTIHVFLYGMEKEEYAIPATYVGGSPNYDIAVLRISNSSVLRSAIQRGSVDEISIADSDKISTGQMAIAIGNAQAYGISVTTGIVSVDSEYITISINSSTQSNLRVIRIDTAVNSGNSGGGLFDNKGKLIGIVNAKIATSDVENIGYAIPSNVVRGIADNIIDYCYGKNCKTVMRGMLGITIEVSESYTKYNTESGLIIKYETIRVASIISGGLGEDILKVGDLLKNISLGGKSLEITRQHHIIDAMLDVRVGDTVTITIIRDGVEKEVSTVITQDCLSAY